MLKGSFLILFAISASAWSQIQSSNFLVPALFSYGSCDAVPYPQTLHVYLATQLQEDTSRALLVASGRTTIRFLWVLKRDNKIDNVFEHPLLELHHEASNRVFCLNYYCDEEPTDDILMLSNGTCGTRNAASGVYAYIELDPTISFIVSNKGPNFMIMYAALPISVRKDTTYHILNPTRYLENYIHAFALRGLEGNNTEVIIVPTSPVKIYHPSMLPEIYVTSAEAYDEIVLTILPFETVWVEAEVMSCDSGVTLTGTLIESSSEMAVFSAQALCNETVVPPPPNSTDNTTGSGDDDIMSSALPFSFILNPLCQLPPVNRWGSVYIMDLKKLQLFSGAEMEFYVLSFSILSATGSSVTITCRGQDVTAAICHAHQLVGKGEIWRYELQAKSMLEANAVVIRGEGPIMVLHEVYSQQRDEPHHSELLQSTEWFSNEQAIPVSYSLDGTRPEAFAITLVIPSDFTSTETIMVWDNMENKSPLLLDDYELIESYTYVIVEDYTLVHLLLDPNGYDEQDYVMQFAVNHTDLDSKIRFGASIFSYRGYAYSNGYILNHTASGEVASYRTPSILPMVLGPVVGTIGAILVIAIAITMVVLCHRKGLTILTWLPLPPSKGFEYDIFLSFADQDKDFAQKILYTPLKNRGYKVLLHLTDFIAGKTIEENIIQAVNTSRVVLYVCSKSFNESSFCQTELKYGMESHYDEYRGNYRRVVPVWIGGECPTQLCTFRIRPIKTPASLESYDEKGISKLIKALKLGKPMHRDKGRHIEEGVELI